MHRLGDFLAVIIGAVEVRTDVAQGLTELRGAGLGEQALEGVGGDFQQQPGFARMHQQARLIEQAAFVQARRTGQGRQARQQAQVMLAQHALDPLGGDGREAATGEFGEAVEVQQLALGKQHHERANRIFKQHRLDLSGRVQARLFDDFRVGDGELCEQRPNDRRGGQWGCGEGNF